MSADDLRPLVEAAFRDRALLQDPAHREAVFSALAHLDQGTLRVASPSPAGAWETHPWVKEAILLYFALRGMERIEVGPFEFHDKIPLKHGLDRAGVRVVLTCAVSYGV